jgi:hypothetical protein
MSTRPTNSLAYLLLPLAFGAAGPACGTSAETGSADSTGSSSLDADHDGFPVGKDCNDDDALVYPGAAEWCDIVDSNCDGDLQLGAVDIVPWFTDADEDGWGDSATVVVACDAPSGTMTRGGDCDDADASVYPYAPERCNAADDDCDGSADEDPIDGIAVWLDQDDDGWGTGKSWQACAAGKESASQPGDCDDLAWAVNPGMEEICGNGVDDDCDGLAQDCP